MNKFDTLLRPCASGLAVTLLVISSALSLISGEKTYLPTSEEEVQILSLVLADEIKANGLASSGTICFSMGGLDPDPSLVKSIRRRGLKVRSSAEWNKKFNCGFEVQMEYTHFDLSESVKVRSKLVDLREINSGQGHLATLQREGEYLLKKTNQKWSISDYFPGKLVP
jgi:hypothetical protein